MTDSFHDSLDAALARHPAPEECIAVDAPSGVGVEGATMSRDECQCPNDCDCDGRFACEAEPSGPGIKGSWKCELVVGHDGWHKTGGHRWPTPAPLADAPDDVEALAAALSAMDDMEQVGTYEGHARAILASDWLAARDADLTARAEARGAAAVLAAVGAAMATPADTPFRAKCAMVAAARAAAASYTWDGADGEADHG